MDRTNVKRPTGDRLAGFSAIHAGVAAVVVPWSVLVPSATVCADPPPASISRPIAGSAGSLITPPPPKPRTEEPVVGDEKDLSGDVDGVSVRIQPAGHPGLPDPRQVESIPVRLEKRDGAWQPAAEGAPAVELGTIRGTMSAAAVSVCSRAVLEAFRARGVDGVVARVVTPEPGKRGPLVVAVVAGTVSGVRTRTIEEDASQKLDDPRNARIAERSPLRQAAEGEAATLLKEQLIDDYLHQLNRTPGRQVSADIVPGDLPGTVFLDYLLQDRKMFMVQVQGSNTGTEQNGRWIEQVGVLGTRILNLDDVMTIQGATNTFDGVYAVNGSWEGRMGDVDQLRWRVEGDWSSYDASDVGIQGNNFTGLTGGGGGSLAWNFLQAHDLFLDLQLGARGWYSSVDQAFGGSGSSAFITPSGQINIFRQNHDSVLSASIGLDYTGANGSTADLTTMGRLNPSRQWWIFRGDALYTFFLDGLFDPGTTSAVHQLTARTSWQLTFGEARPTPVSQGIMGGFYTVRGYPQAAAVGDNTVFGSLQYDFHLLRALPASKATDIFGKPFRWTTEEGTGLPPSWDISPHVFFDAGYTTVNGPTVGELPSATLTSAGIGVTVMIGSDFSVTLDWGIALHGEPGLGVGAGDSQVWFVGSFSF
jgi:hemolysin activation/secretion protein